MNVPARGGTQLRKVISDFLTTAMPPLIDVCRTQWNLADWQLPHPSKYDAIDPGMVANNDYPAIGTVMLNDRDHIRQGFDLHAQQVYSPVYTVRSFVVARTPFDPDTQKWEQDYKETAVRLRDDLTRIFQQVILQTPSLGTSKQARVDEGSMQTDYLEPWLAKTQSARWLAAATISFEVAYTESTYAPPIGNANTFKVDADLLIP